MSRRRGALVVVAVVLAGALGTFVTGAWLGMTSQLAGIAKALVPAALVTVVVALAGGRVLARASLEVRSVGVALIAAGVALVNVFVLSRQMFVSHHDAALVSVIVLFAVGAGVAAAIVVGRRSARAVARLDRTAALLGEGDLTARVGPLDDGEELDRLGTTLDEMAERLQRAQAAERRAEEMRRDLIATMSHDLRTPLATLRATVEAIDDGVVQDAATTRRYVGEMRRSVDQLVALVDDLFELTQLDAGAIAAETRRARVQDVVESAVAAVHPIAREKGLGLEVALGGAADESCSPRVARVLQNLLTNAVRHTPADGTVRLTAYRIGDRLRFAVEDDGEGIAPADLPHVFEPFYRADPARSGPGAGLGLALAKRIVEALGGTIGADEVRPVGARFAVELPRTGPFLSVRA